VVPTDGGIVLSKDELVLTQHADGTVHEFSAVCTHQGCTVDWVKDSVIRCPATGAYSKLGPARSYPDPRAEPYPPSPSPSATAASSPAEEVIDA
jgi:Rieske Fe-S protein